MTFKSEILNHKERAEMQFIASLYDDLELYEEYQVEPSCITTFHWRFFYLLLKAMVEKKKFTKIDEVNMDMFILEQKEELQKKYAEFGGWTVIEQAVYITEKGNVNSYYKDILKYHSILRLMGLGLNVEKDWDQISKFSYEELGEYYNQLVDEIFLDSGDSEDHVFDITDGAWEMIEEADRGINRGLPLNSKALNSIVNGQVLGNITMLAGGSGVGKTFLTLCLTLPSFIEHEEPLLIMCNEEDLTKWQRELYTWVANNVIKKQLSEKNGDFVKSRFYQGDFTKNEWEILKLSHEWVQKRIKNGLIKFVNFNTFNMNKAIKMIKRWTTQEGFKYFIVDTLKLDNDAGTNVSDLSWLHLQQNMVKLYNVIKPTNKNCHVWVTYQLGKSKSRYLDQSNLGISKNVVDVVSTLLMTRKVLLTEKTGNGALKIKKPNGNEIVLDPDKDYQVIFVNKNRMGSTSSQIVLRTDIGKNVLKDVGFTHIAEDY